MMTTLQIVLAIVGVSLIAIIVLYNVLQERKFRKEADRMFSQNRDDFMLGEAVRGEAGKRKTETANPLSDSLAQATEVRPAPDAAPTAPSLFERSAAPASILSSLEPLPATAPAETPEPAPASPEEHRQPAPPAAAQGPAPSAGAAAKPSPEPEPAAPAVVAQPAPAPAPPPAPVQAQAPQPPKRAVPAPVFAEEHFDEPDAPSVQGSGLDAVTEYIARLKFAKPQLANFSALLSVLRRLGKPVRAYAARADGGWEPLSGHPRSMYEQVEFGLQLADRGGALSSDQLDAFCRALYEFAAEEGGAVTCPDREEALQQARELDLFCMDVDVLIGLNVVSAESRPFTSEAMHGLAQEARLSLEADGAFHARDDFGHTLFTLANQGDEAFPRDGRGLTTHGVTLLFDVPRVADGIAVFDRMTRLGFDLAWRLEGRLVDDNGRPVSEESLSRDRARLAQYFARMEARGIPAGGERALRLFV